MLDLVEEPLDQVAILVDILVVGDGLRARAVGGHDCLASSGRNHGTQAVGVVARVGDELVEIEAGDQCFGLVDVVDLAGRQDEAQRVAERIDRGVDLRAQAAARAPDRLCIAPPFAPAAC